MARCSSTTVGAARIPALEAVRRELRAVEVRLGGRQGETYMAQPRSRWGCWIPLSGGHGAGGKTHGEVMVDRMHYCAGYREYWQNVEGCGPDVGDIEIHFVDSIIPGYFWLFRLRRRGQRRHWHGHRPDGQAEEETQGLQADVIANHPLFKERFANATMIEGRPRAGNFLCSRKKESRQPRRAAGSGIRLVGDAASLVDPFSGEGVGNALVTGEMAARHIVEGLTPKLTWKRCGPCSVLN